MKNRLYNIVYILTFVCNLIPQQVDHREPSLHPLLPASSNVAFKFQKKTSGSGSNLSPSGKDCYTTPCHPSMFYMYPCRILAEDIYRQHMSRVAIHIPTHVHLERKVFSRNSLQQATGLLEKHFSANPSTTSSRLKNVATRDLLAQVNKESVVGLIEEVVNELWKTLQVIASPCKFTSLLQSVRKDRDYSSNGVFDILSRMQENIPFPFIQRY
jgi:hypothetical protein